MRPCLSSNPTIEKEKLGAVGKTQGAESWKKKKKILSIFREIKVLQHETRTWDCKK
jgi:hypothetical protein